MIKKFNALKISAPLNEEGYDSTINELSQLKEALLYWGKILQRQNKIKYIRSSRKLKSLEEYSAMAEEEEKWLQNEKQKIENAEADITHGEKKISFNMIKIAQNIDKEIRLRRMWSEEDDEGDEDSDGGYHAEEDDGARGQRGDRRGRAGGAGANADGNHYAKPKSA